MCNPAFESFEDIRRQAREVDESNRARIRAEIAADLALFDGQQTAEEIADAILGGLVRNVAVIY